MSGGDWQPSASLETLRLAAQMRARVRQFFAVRDVLEVETPLLSAAATPAPALESLQLVYGVTDDRQPRRLFLHTSPEFPMKRLLAAGTGSIYQLCRVFRAGERGPRHNPEFTLLEWYRVGFSLPRLIEEVEALLRALLSGLRALPIAEVVTYRALFKRYAGIDGLTASSDRLRACFVAHGHRPPVGLASDDVDAWRDAILSHIIEPQLTGLLFVTDYPASQAALARLLPHTPPVAARFECYLDGMELANGFHELADATEQRARFERENHLRATLGGAPVPLDERLLAALQHGLPDCSGVALGMDRLLMCAIGASHIDQVLAFSHERA